MFLYASVFEEVQNEGKPLVKATMSRLVPMWLARSCFSILFFAQSIEIWPMNAKMKSEVHSPWRWHIFVLLCVCTSYKIALPGREPWSSGYGRRLVSKYTVYNVLVF